MREDKVLVQVDRLLVVACRLGELAQDEVQLRAVVVDVRVVLVLLYRLVEVFRSLVFLACGRGSDASKSFGLSHIPSSKYMLARLM